MAYDNTNRGSLWKNQDKEKETHPDFKGNLNVNGTEFWVSAWKRKEGANPNAPLLTFSIQEKEQRNMSPPPQQQQQPSTDESFDDDIPF